MDLARVSDMETDPRGSSSDRLYFIFNFRTDVLCDIVAALAK